MVDRETLKQFELLYDETYPNVLKYVVCNCSNAEDVKDIVQNIYFDLLKLLQKDTSIKNPNAYIMGIAKNKVNEYYRFNYKAKLVSLFSQKKDVVLLDTIPDDIDLQEEFIKNEDIKFVWQFLKKKKTIIFKIFFLYYYANQTIKDISKELNISESNVKHHLYRTLNELKNIMKSRGDENV